LHRGSLVGTREQNCSQLSLLKATKDIAIMKSYIREVAATMSSNQVRQRSVRHAKQSWVIKREAAFQPFIFDLLADLWLAWGDQVSFMYDPVR
jgi:hypothetical protein